MGMLAGSLLAAPLGAEAQQAGKVWRIGILAPGIPQDPSRSPLLQPLRDLGYVENQNLVAERRYAEGKIDRLPDLAVELVQLKVDVIFAVSTPGVQAAQKATTTIPIVFFGVSDPIGSGVVPKPSPAGHQRHWYLHPIAGPSRQRTPTAEGVNAPCSSCGRSLESLEPSLG